MSENNNLPTKNKVSFIWLGIHWIIIINFLLEIYYASKMVFFVLIPEGASPGPLGDLATKVPFELMMTRRMYASEAWIAITGLCLYIAITEIYPRFWKKN